MKEVSPRAGVERPKLMSPLTLAFVGDGVYELLAREYLAARSTAPVGQLHDRTVELVSAKAQSAAYGRIAGLLTPEEEEIYHRGRNANATHSPKHTDPAVYRRATGVEALFGWLYLSGRGERLEELFGAILDTLGSEENEEETKE